MADFLSTGVSGLLAFKRALDVTGHNIANVGTTGYSRQRVDFNTREAQPYGNGWLGSGVEITAINRVYDSFLALQVRTATSAYERFQTFATQAERVNNMFANADTGLAASLQRFSDAVQGVANTPTSVAARQVLLSEAQGLADRLQQYDGQLTALDREIETRIASEANDISTLARGIAQLNGEIKNALGSTGQPPNDLLDQRDRLLDELSAKVNVNLAAQDNGTVNVFVGNGQPLVLGETPARLVTRQDAYDSSRSYIALEGANGSVDVTSGISGGRLGGLLDFRSEILDPARNSLGRMSAALTEVVNTQHRSGIDLTGALGQDLFAVGGVQTLPNGGNTGAATVTVTRTDIGALTESDYILEMTGGGWELRNQATGANVPLTGSGTLADPFQAAGLSVVVGGGAAAAGDSYLIRPTRNAISGLDVLISDPARIAAASAIRTAADSQNAGTGEISAGEVIDPSNAQLRDPVTIEFLTPTTYSINGAGSFAYTSGDPIEVNGWRVEISGAPAVGDTFTISDNAGGTGDNRNALLLADAINRPVLDGGTTSLDGAVGRFIGDIGVVTRQAQINRDAQQAVQTESAEARDSVSGVNLDEEAANLMRYQQAYQAAAQLIRVASTMFDSLLAATSRR